MPRVSIQGEGDWTERQRQLFRDAAGGEERVVLIASDSPQLTVGVVEDAFRKLDRHDLVFGPTYDGGYYLIGMRGFHDVLSGIPMSTGTVLDDITRRAEQIGLSVGWVETTFDIDEVEDLEHLRRLAATRADLAATRTALEALGLYGVEADASVHRTAQQPKRRGGVEMKFVGRWIKVLGTGLLAGLVAALFMTVVLVLLRLFAGVGLPAELGGDRFLPTFSVDEFLALLGRNGGPIAAKRKALLSGFGGQLGVGVAFGVLYAFIVEIGRGRDPERPRPFGISITGALFVGVTLIVIWAVTLAVLWPTLGTNNRGLLPGIAVVVTAIGFLVLYASYGIALILVHRFITSRRPLREPSPVGEPIGRRAFLAGAGGVVLAAASGGLVKKDLRRLDALLRWPEIPGRRHQAHHAQRPLLRGHEEHRRPQPHEGRLEAHRGRGGGEAAYVRLRRHRLYAVRRAGDDPGVHQQRNRRRADEQRRLERHTAYATCSRM